jgi:type IV secretion system protein VirD4
VIDPKLEIAAITANYRRKVCGADNVKIINPFGLLVDIRPDLKSDQWNPLNDLDPTAPDYGDHCAAKGDALVKTDSNEHQKYFPDAARSGITGAIPYIVKDADAKGLPRSLPSIKAIFGQEPAALKKSIKKMIAGGDFDISSRLAKFLAVNDEISGIKNTIETSLSFLTRQMRDDMATAGGVDFRACKERPTTIYVGLPTQELNNKAVYLRLVLSSVLRALYREGGVPTTLVVEEAFVLGYHAELEQALSILRGFGSRLRVVF